MADLSVTAAKVHAVVFFEQLPDGPAEEAIDAGQAVRLATATGQYTKANATAAGEARVIGIATQSALAGQTLTGVVRRGVIELGGAITQAYDAPIYLSDTDGTLADTAGTVSTVIGRVLPAWGSTTADKLLLVAL